MHTIYYRRKKTQWVLVFFILNIEIKGSDSDYNYTIFLTAYAFTHHWKASPISRMQLHVLQ